MMVSSPSSQLKDLVRAIRQCKTANEERTLVARECANLRDIFKEDSSDSRCVAVTKLLYFYILGYPAHFGQMECLKLIASSRFVDKRIGYLGCMMLLDELADVHVLVTNCLKNDLSHSSQHVQGLALCTLASICSSDMARMLSPEVEGLIRVSSAYLKKKAALCATRIVSKAPDLAQSYLPFVKTLVNDSNIGVQLCGITLTIVICELDHDNVEKVKKMDIVPRLCKELKNVLNYGSSREHCVHGVSNPFLQVKIIRLLSTLAKDDATLSESISDLLAQVITNTQIGKNAGNSIIYEATLAIFNISSSRDLRLLATNLLGKFLQSNDKNTKYIAVTTMLKIVSRDMSSVMRHRAAVLDCISENDLSIKKRAIELSFFLIDNSNVISTVERLLACIPTCEPELQQYITSNIITSMERYAQDKEWQINTFLGLLDAASTYVRDDAVSHFVSVVSSNPDVQGSVVSRLYDCLKKDYFKPVMNDVACWCIGEYGGMLFSETRNEGLQFNQLAHVGGVASCHPAQGQVTTSEVVALLRTILRSNLTSNLTKYIAIYALAKLAVRVPSIEKLAYEAIKDFRSHIDPEIQQRALEFCLAFSKNQSLCEGLFETMPTLSLRQNCDKEEEALLAAPQRAHLSSSVPASKPKEKVPDILDLLGLDVLSGAADSTVAFGSACTGTGVRAGTEASAIVGTGAATGSHDPQNKVHAYSKNGLIVELECRHSPTPASISITIKAKNSGTERITNCVFEAAVPKAMSVSMCSPTASDLLPTPNNGLSQSMTVNNPNKAPLKMRLRIRYTIKSVNFEEVVGINEFCFVP